MREEYDFSSAQKNPYAKRLKRQVTINLDVDVVDYFKAQSDSSGIPYQTLINLYLADCASNKRTLKLSWSEDRDSFIMVSPRNPPGRGRRGSG